MTILTSFVVFLEQDSIIEQVVVEACRCRVQQHHPLHHARDLDDMIQKPPELCNRGAQWKFVVSKHDSPENLLCSVEQLAKSSSSC